MLVPCPLTIVFLAKKHGSSTVIFIARVSELPGLYSTRATLRQLARESFPTSVHTNGLAMDWLGTNIARLLISHAVRAQVSYFTIVLKWTNHVVWTVLKWLENMACLSFYLERMAMPFLFLPQHSFSDHWLR